MLDARERRVAYWAIAAALLLHIAIAIVCIVDWAALLDLALAKADVPDAIPVTLVYAPPPPPPAPSPQLQPPPPQPQPQPQPPIAPRMSGPDEKTEAKLEDTPQPVLPQAKWPPPPESVQQQKKPAPAPQRAGNKETASVPLPSIADREAAAPAPALQKEAASAPLFHSIRLPSQHGGAGERDTAGDAYLNRMKDIVEKHRIYPPPAAFMGGAERLVVLSILVDPGGDLVHITLLASSGSSVADEAAGNMIRSSAPFPPIPASYPHIRTSIIVEMPIYPSPR
jgi:protein TonB